MLLQGRTACVCVCVLSGKEVFKRTGVILSLYNKLKTCVTLAKVLCSLSGDSCLEI